MTLDEAIKHIRLLDGENKRTQICDTNALYCAFGLFLFLYELNLAIIRCRIFCLPAFYPKEQDILNSNFACCFV